MDDPKRDEDRKDDEELEVDEQDVSDLQVPEGESDEAKGGMMPSTSSGCRRTDRICR